MLRPYLLQQLFDHVALRLCGLLATKFGPSFVDWVCLDLQRCILSERIDNVCPHVWWVTAYHRGTRSLQSQMICEVHIWCLPSSHIIGQLGCGRMDNVWEAGCAPCNRGGHTFMCVGITMCWRNGYGMATKRFTINFHMKPKICCHARIQICAFV